MTEEEKKLLLAQELSLLFEKKMSIVSVNLFEILEELCLILIRHECPYNAELYRSAIRQIKHTLNIITEELEKHMEETLKKINPEIVN